MRGELSLQQSWWKVTRPKQKAHGLGGLEVYWAIIVGKKGSYFASFNWGPESCWGQDFQGSPTHCCSNGLKKKQWFPKECHNIDRLVFMRRAGIVFCPWNGIMSYSNPNYLKTHLPLSSRKHLWIASEIRVRCTEYAQRHSYPVHPSTLAILLFQAWHNDVANDKGCTLDSTARHQSETWQKRRWRITAETIRPSHWETAKIAKVSNRDAIVWVLVVSSVGCASDLYTGLWQGHLLQKIWSCLPPIVGDIQACPCSQQDWNTLKLPSQNAKDQWTCTIVMVGQSCQFDGLT